MYFGAVVGGLILPAEAAALWWTICLSALPGFLTGFAEDVTKSVSVRTRLLATIVSGLIFCLVSGYTLGPPGLPGVDQLMGFWLVSLLITSFAMGGIANAINIIDGVNGLASGTAIIILSGFALIAWQVQDDAVLAICLLMIGAIAGFFLMNFPLGRIFFGDAGAYATGFVLAVIAVILPLRNTGLSPILGLLALAYPVIETMVSIHRRMIRQGTHPGQPDRLHLHSLVYRDFARRLARAIGAPQLRNPMTALVIWVLPLTSTALLVHFADSTPAIWLCLALLTLVYLAIYRRVAMLVPMLRWLRRDRSARLRVSGAPPERPGHTEQA
ncbi:Undecaprenyl-phosphate alpha-N-acetylglucosaminyl 1-phosphate transferase [Paracoccus haematequi]|uniref:Undecaprenyl-phosphate alpha-N-acetylglucosaminyl 1-phosphate transferase n=1 Tax=Paracoccus haematequi TaxID=2491866 RepID=A0A3S4GM29_9RHOB|nr:glycosyltransferase [Paracoccus haematequi]VDS07865.1 Undecaprenyl-phosphate alpha-N-acetylglucosaminyl 1-phosphate transferase [Paracoccus haematequi]